MLPLKILHKKWGGSIQVNLTKEFLLNENPEILKILVKKWWGLNLKKEIPLNGTSKKTKFCSNTVGVNLEKEIPFNKISEKLKILLKKVKGVQFYNRNPFKRNYWKAQKFAQKNERGGVQSRSILQKKSF